MISFEIMSQNYVYISYMYIFIMFYFKKKISESVLTNML